MKLQLDEASKKQHQLQDLLLVAEQVLKVMLKSAHLSCPYIALANRLGISHAPTSRAHCHLLTEYV